MFTKIIFPQVLKIVHDTAVYAPSAQSGGFDFKGLAIILAGISFGLIGVVMAGAAFFPDQVEQYKRHIPTTITGLILVGLASTIVAAMGG